MARGITLRWLLLLVTALAGLLVLVLVVRGVPGGLRSAGVDVNAPAGIALLRSVAATQFVRGIIAIILTLLIVWPLAAGASRMLDVARLRDPAGARQRWLDEARELADWIDRDAKDQAWHVESVARQRSDLARLLEAVSEGILQIDRGGRLVRANRAARRLLALPDDAEGRPLAAVVRSAELRSLLERAAGEDGLPPAEIAFEERTLIITARALPAAAEDGGPAGLAVAIADLTALRKLESVRRDFVANASHELKTPLTSIRGYAETLQDETLSPDMRRQFLATISSNAQRLQNIVDDLLDLSRLESGSWQPSITAVQPADAAREAWQDLERRARERKLEFAIRVDSDEPVAGDASALRQILTNLFDNAIRHTSSGRIEARVIPWPGFRVEPGARERRGRHLAIEVRDTGAGIPGDALPRIFERFYRVDPARSRSEGGTGLGLSIVRHLTESMGGSVEAESQLGKGTTIRVILPVMESGGEGSTVS